MPLDPRFDRHPEGRDWRSREPLIYESAGVVFPVAAVVGDPKTFTYRVCWCQAIPRARRFAQYDATPIVTTDRSIVLRHGYGAPTIWGVPHIISTVAVQSATLCCVHVRTASHQQTAGWVERAVWWYFRISPTEVCSIDNRALTEKEWDILTTAMHREPLRGISGRDRSSWHIPTIYRYPAHKQKRKGATSRG